MGDTPIGLAILGSTGSIGRQTLQVVREFDRRFRVVALAAGYNGTLLEEQSREFRPELLFAERDVGELVNRLRHWGLDCQPASLDEMASHPDVDLVVVGTVGRVGLAPSLAALKNGKSVALANKEVLVMAGHIIAEMMAEKGGELRPIDSEHSAIWQCLWGEDAGSVERIILTASGGPFRDTPLEELARVTAEEALRHPNWQMGRKITVDSSTLLNKGLECIEARWLFNIPLDQVTVLLHRESIVHSLVEFKDGSVKAQLGMPDMHLPIQCAISYPERLSGTSVSRLDLTKVGALHFEEVDMQRFPCLALSLEAGRMGSTYPAVLAAADEAAVEHFLAGHIGFLDIARAIEDVLAGHEANSDSGLDAVLAADSWARTQIETWVKVRN